MYTEQNLHGKRATITGASSGIGAATAFELAAQGVDLFLVARRGERLEEIKQKLGERFPVTVTTIVGNVCRGETQSAMKKAGAFDVDFFINNAGLARGRDEVAEARLDHWAEMIDTNITAAFQIGQLAAQAMIRRGRGHIVFTGSIAGHVTYVGGSVYSATKHAVTAFAKTLREETCDKGLKVTIISPGMVETEFSLVRLDNPISALKVYEGMTPLVGEDIAHQIIFCLKQPRHVNIDEIIVTPQAQGAATRVHRVAKT